jgi:hypothetical protein
MRRIGCVGYEILLLGACSIVGCVASSGESSPPVFGGEGANLKIRGEAPLPEAPKGVAPTGPCAGRVVPAGDVALLDDFEDHDTKVFKAFQREGWWYVAADETQGTVHPPRGTFSADPLPAGEGSTDNAYAAHFSAEGFKDWGAVWGTTLSWSNEGIRCPYNASGFEALRFRAKGKGSVTVKVAIPETQPKDDGGACESKCYDFHGKLIDLKSEWSEYVVRFDRLQQGGWGTEARFNPATLTNVSFHSDSKSMPVDFWVDDIEFVPKGAPQAQQAAAAAGRAP